jgi:hypothetical protein
MEVGEDRREEESKGGREDRRRGARRDEEGGEEGGEDVTFSELVSEGLLPIGPAQNPWPKQQYECKREDGGSSHHAEVADGGAWLVKSAWSADQNDSRAGEAKEFAECCSHGCYKLAHVCTNTRADA